MILSSQVRKTKTKSHLLSELTLKTNFPQVFQQLRPLRRTHRITQPHLVTTQLLVHMIQSFGKRHHRVRHKLELLLKGEGFPGEFLSSGTFCGVMDVVRGAATVRVLAPKVIFPELYRHTERIWVNFGRNFRPKCRRIH